MIQTYFNRYEIKYQISLEKRDEIIKSIQNFMHRDHHTKDGFDYEVRSLYFDSPFRKALQEKINGVDYRKKLRIRYYPSKGDHPVSPQVFIEVKRKRIENVSKSRILVPLQNAVDIVNENSIFAQESYKAASPQGQNTLNEIWFLNRRFHLEPACIVSYNRQAFVDNQETRFRLTFDTSVKVRTSNFDLLDGFASKYIVPPNVAIMEVKFNEKIPRWAVRLLNVTNCYQEKISKFAEGLQKMHTLCLN